METVYIKNEMTGFELMFKPFIKGVHALAGSWMAAVSCMFAAFFGENVLDFFVEAESAIKVISVLVTVVLAVLTFIISQKEKGAALKKMQLEYENAAKDQIKEDIAWLIEKGWIPENPTADEMREGLAKLAEMGKVSGQ